jgi:hypothetical protein
VFIYSLWWCICIQQLPPPNALPFGNERSNNHPPPADNAVPTAAPVIVEYWADPPTSAPIIVEYWTDPPTNAPTIVEYWPVTNQPAGLSPSETEINDEQITTPSPPTSAPVIVEYWPVPNQPEGPDPNNPTSDEKTNNTGQSDASGSTATENDDGTGQMAIRTGVDKSGSSSNSFWKHGSGIALICILVVALLILVVACCFRRKNKGHTTKTSHSRLPHQEQNTIMDATECNDSSSSE